jgi:diguanylate cyclase (GGDEF)-like protein
VGSVSTAIIVTRVGWEQLQLFAVLLACGTAVELSLWPDKRGERGRGLHGIWDLPTVVLLPPVYALLAPPLRTALTLTRPRRSILRRRAWSATAMGLASAAASVAFHRTVCVLGAGTGGGERVMLWTLLVTGAGLLRLVVNDGLVLVAGKESAPKMRSLGEIVGAEALLGKLAELSLSTLSAFAALHSALAVLYAVPLVIPLTRSLRHAQLVAENRVDGKTGLLNDKTWRDQAAVEVARAVRTGTPLAVGILDIDHFKKVNDNYGHLAGDAVLAAVAAAIAALIREYDVVGRVGGEEFGFVFPNSLLLEAVEIAERLRQKIPAIVLQSESPIGVTVSVGLAIATHPDQDLTQYYHLADQALYAAKRNGRDAVWIVQADGSTDPPRPSRDVRA